MVALIVPLWGVDALVVRLTDAAKIGLILPSPPPRTLNGYTVPDKDT